MGCRLWGHTESDTTGATQQQQQQQQQHSEAKETHGSGTEVEMAESSVIKISYILMQHFKYVAIVNVLVNLLIVNAKISILNIIIPHL